MAFQISDISHDTHQTPDWHHLIGVGALISLAVKLYPLTDIHQHLSHFSVQSTDAKLQ